MRTGNSSRERLHPRPAPPEPQLIPIPMTDGDDDQPPQRERQRQRSRSREYILTYKCHRYQKFNQRLLQNQMMMYQMRILQLLTPHNHHLDHHNQLNRGSASEETKDLDRVSEDLHIHPRMPASSHNLLHLLQDFSRHRQLRAKMKIQQLWIHEIA